MTVAVHTHEQCDRLTQYDRLLRHDAMWQTETVGFCGNAWNIMPEKNVVFSFPGIGVMVSSQVECITIGLTVP